MCFTFYLIIYTSNYEQKIDEQKCYSACNCILTFSKLSVYWTHMDSEEYQYQKLQNDFLLKLLQHLGVDNGPMIVFFLFKRYHLRLRIWEIVILG